MDIVAGSDIDMLPKLDDALHGQKGNLSLEDTLRTDLDSILQRQPNRQILNRERDLNIYRSGSAPPTVEGSLNAVGSLLTNSISSSGSGSGFVAGGGSNGSINGILSEDEIRSHPAYLSYYYSHENINPRLPPPLMSKEDWRVAQRFQGGGPSLGDIGDWRKKGMDGGDRSSLFSTQPGLSVQQAENDLLELRNAARRNLSRNTSGEWLERGSDGLIGLPAAGLGVRRKSFADILQVIDASRFCTNLGHWQLPYDTLLVNMWIA